MPNVVIGTSADKNGYNSDRPLDLTGLDGLVVVDANYFDGHMTEVVQAVLRLRSAVA